MSFGLHVQHFRRVKGWSQGRLASEVGCSRSAIATWDSGQSIPDFALGCQIAKALGVSSTELHAGPGQFAANVVELRIANNMDSLSLANRLEMKPAALTRLELGRVSVEPDSALAAAIASVFECDAGTLFEPIDICEVSA
jgi:transcriptional regulator with XRE-family HTH domain